MIKSSKAKKGFYLLCAVFIALLVIFDQFTKGLAVRHLKGTEGRVLIPGALELQYVENRGAAFGMLQGKQWFFWILTAVFLVFAVLALVRIRKVKRFYPLIICLLVLCAGAIGNLIDRVAHRFVVDFIYFSLIRFPVFNVADIYVSLSVIVLILLVLFKYKNAELDTLFKEKAEGEAKGEPTGQADPETAESTADAETANATTDAETSDGSSP